MSGPGMCGRIQSELKAIDQLMTAPNYLNTAMFRALYNSTRPPLLMSMHRCPPQQREQFVYVAINLKRPSVEKPWGVSFAMFDDRIILGYVEDGVKDFKTNWLRVVEGKTHTLDYRMAYTPIAVHANIKKSEYAKILKEYVSVFSSRLPKHQRLFPGDLIIAIDGHPPSSFRSFTEVTYYLQRMQNVTLVVARHPQATTAALAFFDLYQSAGAANVAWTRVLSGFHNPPSLQMPLKPRSHSPVQERSVNPLELLCQVATGGLAVKAPIQVSTSSDGAIRQVKNEWMVSAQTMKEMRPCYTVDLKIPAKKSKATEKSPPPLPDNWRNPWFKNDHKPIPYDDNWEFSPEDGSRAKLFLPPVEDFKSWLEKRKGDWRSKYRVYKHDPEKEAEGCDFGEIRTVSKEFWAQQDFSSFEDWLSESLVKWKFSYSWNKRKRKRILRECEEIVHTSQGFQHWLRVRKGQWRVQRRKRQRLKEELVNEQGASSSSRTEGAYQSSPGQSPGRVESSNTPLLYKRRKLLLSPTSNEIACIDDILEEEERHRNALKNRPPIDISFLFHSTKGAPDDVVVHCLNFLHHKEHGKLLCISKGTSKALKERGDVWRQLCPPHWILPRRPRKPWHDLYISGLRTEERDCRKRWDDLLLKCSTVLTKGDHLQKIEKLVMKGITGIDFDVNYTSGVVCERNSLLNLAVINKRHKVVRWLVDEKGADIESYDRGQFNPLLNAAWTGDRQLVRFFLQRGADRAKIGTGHYSCALAHPDFEGLNAEGWARKKGHEEIAELIRLGL